MSYIIVTPEDLHVGLQDVQMPETALEEIARKLQTIMAATATA